MRRWSQPAVSSCLHGHHQSMPLGTAISGLSTLMPMRQQAWLCLLVSTKHGSQPTTTTRAGWWKRTSRLRRRRARRLSHPCLRSSRYWRSAPASATATAAPSTLTKAASQTRRPRRPWPRS
uniref:Uncharacterized protein n=1 Tax=Arundo donax TaxID=35708 RepID=A0A0A9VEX6_ARUDO